MQYEKPSQTAKRLGVTARAIQKWANEGRIKGACKIAGQWMIPADFTEPTEKNSLVPGKQNQPIRPSFSLISSDFFPGECLTYVNSLSSEDEKNVTYAEYCYYIGDAERAIRITEAYLQSKDPYLCSTACLIYIFASLGTGHVHQAKYALAILQQYLLKTQNSTASQVPQVKSMSVWLSHASTVLLYCPPLTDEPLENWIKYLPDGMKLFSCYILAHQMCLVNKFQGAHAVAKIAIEITPGRHVIPEIYCRLIDAIALINMRHVDDAERQFMSAWKLAQADGFIEPFAEHYLLLQGIVERCLKNSYPKEYQQIKDGAAVFSKHWRSLHNDEASDNVSTELSVTEFSIAMMYTRNWSAKEIAAHLDMSVRTVYRYISNIYATLGVRSVAELKEYMLK